MGFRGLAPSYARDLACHALWSDWYARGHNAEPKGAIMLWVKAFGVWLGMLVAAFLNGALRELLIVPYVGEPVGHVVSVFILSGAIFGLAYLFVKAHPPLPPSMLFQVGLFWLLLSLLFEFGFFHYAMHEPWEKLFADYNLVRRRLLIVVWLTVLFSPLICGKLTRGKGIQDGGKSWW